MHRTLARLMTALAVGILTAATISVAQSTDPFVGTWKLNLAKSTYSPGPPPKSVTSTYAVAGKGYKVTVKTEPASGPAQEWTYTSDLDGKDVPVSGNNPNADMLAPKRINASTLELVSKKGGKVTTTARNVVAPDGKTRTVTTTGTNAQGQKVNNVAVYEKQ